jgi:hypothetical protein
LRHPSLRDLATLFVPKHIPERAPHDPMPLSNLFMAAIACVRLPDIFSYAADAASVAGMPGKHDQHLCMLPASPYRDEPGGKVVGTHTKPAGVTGVINEQRSRERRAAFGPAATPPRRHAATPPRRHAATPPRRHAATPPRGHRDTRPRARRVRGARPPLQDARSAIFARFIAPALARPPTG